MGNDGNENNPQMTRMDTDGGPLAEQCLNCSDYLSADVRQMLYGFSSVSDLFNICGFIGPQADGDVVSNCHE